MVAKAAIVVAGVIGAVVGVTVAAATVVKAPVAAVPRTADPAVNAVQVAVQPKPPEAAAVAVVLEPRPVEASQKQNADPAKTLAAAPKAPPARWRRCFQPALRAGPEATVYIQNKASQRGRLFNRAPDLPFVFSCVAWLLILSTTTN